jgi:hypothetical protein
LTIGLPIAKTRITPVPLDSAYRWLRRRGY